MKVVIQWQLKRYQAGYSSELYQNVVYAHHLHIMLVHTQNVKAMFDGYLVIIRFVMVEICVIFCGDTVVERALRGTAH